MTDDGMAQKAATLAGAGISINSLWNVHEELCDGRLLRVLPGFRLDADTALWLVYPKTNILSPKVRVFMDYLLEKIWGCDVFSKTI